MIIIGTVASAHGIGGQIKIRSFTAKPENVASYGEVSLADGRRLQLTLKAVIKGLAVCKVEGVTTRDEAEALKSQTLYLARSALPELAEDEIYHADLIGMHVYTSSALKRGKIVAMHDFGAGDVAEIIIDGKKQTQMLPFYHPFLKEVDHQKGVVILDSEDDQEDESDA